MTYQITAHAAIRYFLLATMSGDVEVGGYAKFHIDEHGTHIITDMRPIKQESSECYFEISEKENALFLEKLVEEGEDPADWSMLFHTHPSGMSADMSGVDVKQLEEMAKDLPGKIARSMILPQGEIYPMMHEAICVDGRVFMRKSSSVQILDTTKAHADLKAIGWFDPKPKPKVPTQRTGYTHRLPAPTTRHPAAREEREMGGMWGGGRQFSNNDGWFDEAPTKSEIRSVEDSAAWDAWAEEKAREDKEALEQAADAIGTEVMYEGKTQMVVDSYVWHGTVVYVLDNGKEAWEDEVSKVEPATLREAQ